MIVQQSTSILTNLLHSSESFYQSHVYISNNKLFFQTYTNSFDQVKIKSCKVYEEWQFSVSGHETKHFFFEEKRIKKLTHSLTCISSITHSISTNA